MKKMRKLVSILLAVVMVLAMTVVVSADDYTITINQSANDKAEHTYDAYQVFAGDLSDDVLSNIVWGSGVNTTKIVDGKTLIQAVAEMAGFSGVTTASDVAEKLTEGNAEAFAAVVSKYLSDTATASSEKVTGNATITVSNAGYYFIKDRENPGNQGASTSFILQVVKNISVNAKSDVPSVTKKVDDKNDSNANEDTTTWQDSADYDIGDSVPFQLTGTLPSNYGDYDYYTYEFHDTLSNGLTYNNDAKVYVVNGDEKIEVTNQFDVTGAISNIKIDNLKAITGVTITKDSKIVVEYTATLNNNAVIGKVGNPNTVYLTYSNNPNATGAGDNETGNTPEDKVIVFTYETVVDKINGEYAALQGAAFTLYKKFATAPENGTAIDSTKYPEYSGYYEVGTSDAGTATEFIFKGIDAGDYVLVETTTPAGYNTVAPIAFTVTATHDASSDNPALTGLTVSNTALVAYLDAGTITKKDNTSKEAVSGEIYTEVINNQGATLPETGGIGTTIFYVLGTVLVLGAAILLITKKRMNAEK